AGIALPGDDAAKTKLPVKGMMQAYEAAVDGFEYRVTGPGGPSNGVTIDYAQAPVVVETEPNNEPAQATKLTRPRASVGQFFPANAPDWVTFDAKKGDEFFIDVYSHRLGMATDPSIVIQKVTKDAMGKEVVTNVGEADDSSDRQQRIGNPFDVTTD